MKESFQVNEQEKQKPTSGTKESYPTSQLETPLLASNFEMDQQAEQKLKTESRTKIVLLAIYWVVIYIIIASLYTGFTFLYTTVPFMLRNAFAKIGMLFFFSALAIKELLTMDQEQKNSIKLLWKHHKRNYPMALFSYIMVSLLYVFPSKFTTIAQNMLFSSCSGICIVIWKCFTKQQQPFLAIIGTILGISGTSLTALEQNQTIEGQEFSLLSMIFGNFLAFVGAAFGAVYTVYMAIFMQYKLPIGIYCSIGQTACILCALLYSITVEYQEIQTMVITTDFIWITLLVGFIGFYSGYAVFLCLKYVSPLVFNIACLSQFMISALQAWIMGINEFPGIWIWMGGIITVLGLFIIIKAEDMESKKKNISQEQQQESMTAEYQKLKEN